MRRSTKILLARYIENNNGKLNNKKIRQLKKLIEILTKAGLSVELLDRHSEGDTLLMRAVRVGNYEVVRLLVEEVSIDAENSDFMTALMLAAELGNEKMIDLLLKLGANPNIQSFPWTLRRKIKAVNYATSCGHYKIFRKLYDCTNLLEGDRLREKLLIYDAIQSGNLKIIQFLLNQGVSVNCYDGYGNTPLLLAARVGKVRGKG